MQPATMALWTRGRDGVDAAADEAVVDGFGRGGAAAGEVLLPGRTLDIAHRHRHQADEGDLEEPDHASGDQAGGAVEGEGGERADPVAVEGGEDLDEDDHHREHAEE